MSALLVNYFIGTLPTNTISTTYIPCNKFPIHYTKVESQFVLIWVFINWLPLLLFKKYNFILTRSTIKYKKRHPKRFRWIKARRLRRLLAKRKFKHLRKVKKKIPFFKKKIIKSQTPPTKKRRKKTRSQKARWYLSSSASGFRYVQPFARRFSARLKHIRSRFRKKKHQAIQTSRYLVEKDMFLTIWPILKSTPDTPDVLFGNTWVWLHYMRYLTYLYTKFYTSWCFLDLAAVVKKDEFHRWWRVFYKRYVLRAFFTNKAKFFNWFAQLSYLKDPQGIIWLAEKIITEAHLKKHKRLFALLARILRSWYNVLHRVHKAQGVSLFFKGKLGKKGSVKKSKFFNKSGLVSLSSKKLRMNYRSFIITTHTGVIGAAVSVFY